MTERVPWTGLLVVFWLSGAAALVYEVLWLKQLGRLFGVTAYASSTTLAVFFLGLSLGGWIFSRVAPRLRNPLRTYAWLELGIAASALLYFGLFRAYSMMQAPLFGGDEYRPLLALGLKFLLSIGILLAPSFLMGGTLPVMSEFFVKRREQLGARATILYSANTLGATTGALLAGFVLPRVLGFNGAYLVAVGMNVVIAATVWHWSRSTEPRTMPAQRGHESREEAGVSFSVGQIRALAMVSGAATLALEVIWTRMVAQVLQNSVYTFALILATFLLSLSLGAALAHRIARRSSDLRRAMWALLVASGILVALTPLQFRVFAGLLEFEGSNLGFNAYVIAVFVGLLGILGPAVLVMGAVFPYLMRLSEESMQSAGRTVGELASINTAAAMFGSLLAGFVLLQTLGLWASIWLVAAVYAGAAAIVGGGPRRTRGAAGIAMIALVASASAQIGIIDPGAADSAGEVVVESWEGPDGTVAVTSHGEGDLRLRVNSSYNLGTTASAPNERLQGQMPALFHADPKSVFFLGLGTGITASGAVQFPFDRIDICELNPDVVRAAGDHFGPWLRGLYDDPRVRILPEDGRTWLSTHETRYDLIVADIFLSYKIGVGSLYTREHFEVVKSRLNPDGVFVQWITIFDTTEEEFWILARTMLEVFPSVTLWRRSFSPVYPVFALVGSQDENSDLLETYGRRVELLREDEDLDERTWIFHIPYAAYVADLRRFETRAIASRLNTDDRTWLEYSAPITERDSKGSQTTVSLSWEPLLLFCQNLQKDSDPRLSLLESAERNQVLAGTAFYGYEVMRRLQRSADAQRYLELYQSFIR